MEPINYRRLCVKKIDYTYSRKPFGFLILVSVTHRFLLV
jgi:hypothetical protein